MDGYKGLRIEGLNPGALQEANRAIVDYRGDMTIERRSTASSVTGYVFDCVENDDPARAMVRLLLKDVSCQKRAPT